MQEGISIKVRRTQLGRVRGSGSAKAGVHHWYAERVSAIALVPLTLWFIFSMLRLVGAQQETVLIWAAHPLNAVLMLALIVMTFHHMALGIQVVLEDYVHDKWAQTGAILATKAICGLLGLLAALSVLKLALW
jgi:succinate dehydrogenase / fumarate reductase membrane anchor subunit